VPSTVLAESKTERVDATATITQPLRE